MFFFGGGGEDMMSKMISLRCTANYTEGEGKAYAAFVGRICDILAILIFILYYPFKIK